MQEHSRNNVPALQGVDHVHLCVPDKAAAAEWYADHLGFQVVERFRVWDTGSGPLVMRDQHDTVHIALFAREQYTPISAIALGADSEGFSRWREYLQARNLPLREADHGLSRSLYFADPWGNEHEITTYPES